MPTLQLAALTAAIAAAIGFGSAWQIQSWRADTLELEHVTEKLDAEREIHQLDQARSSALAAAQNAARTRDVSLRADADAARGALIGLSSSADAALRSAGAGLDACLVTATAASQLLNQCARQYQDMGAAADRHVNDIKTLMAAWPR